MFNFLLPTVLPPNMDAWHDALALQAFSCHTFEDGAGSFLAADVTVECSTDEFHSKDHERIKRFAWVAIFVYPIGYMVLIASLLFAARKAILNKRPTRLSRAISFVYREFHPSFYFWEVSSCSQVEINSCQVSHDL